MNKMYYVDNKFETKTGEQISNLNYQGFQYLNEISFADGVVNYVEEFYFHNQKVSSCSSIERNRVFSLKKNLLVTFLLPCQWLCDNVVLFRNPLQ